MSGILNMTALEIGAEIKIKNISPVEVTQVLLNEINKKDGVLNAYITVCAESALKRAEEVRKLINSGEFRSPIAGVPISIKDNICTKNIKTSCASKILGDFKPPYDAAVISKLYDSGAIIPGKLNMDEFAMGSTNETSFYGAVKNPWDITRVPGGSSGGGGAAVAAGEAIVALGSDTGGSVRLPASYCGVTGFKPTYGTVSRYGLIAYASSLDQIGPIAKDAADCAAIMDIIAGKDKFDGTSLDLKFNYLQGLTGDMKGLKIGLPKECFDKGLDPGIKEKVLETAKVLENLGAVIEETSLPLTEYLIPAYYIISRAEASSNLSRFDGVKYGYRSENYDNLTDLYAQTRSGGFGEEVKRRIIFGTFALSSGYYDAYYKKALKVKNIIKNKFDELFGRYDLLITPTAPSVAPKIGDEETDKLKLGLCDIFTVSVNLAGLPAVSIPCGFDENMPVGTQIIGNALSDVKVLNAAYAYQQATNFHKIKPNISGGENL